MLKNDFFLAAMKAELYKKKSFVISAFSLIREDISKWKQDPYLYRIVQTPTGNFFVNDKQELTKIEDSLQGEPVLKFKDEIELKTNQIPNLKKDIISTVGNVFFNYCCIINPFGNKMDYVEGKVNLGSIENEIAKRLSDTNSLDKEDEKTINVKEYLKYSDSVLYLTNFTQLCVWAGTEKTMTPPPGLKEFKNSLFEKYKGQLNDPTVVAMIDAELIAFDNEYLKGDPGENFLMDGKPKKARKRLFLMYGAETGFDATVGVDIVKNSLNEGWELDKFPIMSNALRAKSYYRGAETQLGGESVKWLLRASSNLNVVADDCGSRIGKQFLVTENNIKKLIGFNIIVQEGIKEINEDTDTSSYLGKKIMVRSPMYCKLDKTDFCKACIGKKLSLNPTGLSLAVSEYGSKFMLIFMSKVHTKALTLAKIDYKIHLT
jgi:hypothetical protein